MEGKYWIFWNDKIYNSGIGHWVESEKEVQDIIENGFYDGEGNKVEDFIITDYNLNGVYKQGEQIDIDDTVLPNIKLVGEYRYVDLKSKLATDVPEEAVLMSILKNGERYDGDSLMVYTKEENGDMEQVANSEIVERIKNLREEIIQKYMPDYIEKKQLTGDEAVNYNMLLREISEMVWKCHQGEKSNEMFKEEIKEFVEKDDSLRISGINKTVEDIKTLMREENKVLEEEDKGKE